MVPRSEREVVPDGGAIRIDGQPVYYDLVDGVRRPHSRQSIANVRAKLGMVFQNFNLFRHLTAIDNVMAGPLHVRGMARPAAEALARTLLKQVGLEEKAAAFPNQLSGGQQQRVAIARALAMSPGVMLLDEPTSALDPELTQEVVATIRSLAGQGLTLVIATHEMAIVRDFADRVLFMVQGELVEDASPEEFFRAPRHERARQFVARHA